MDQIWRIVGQKLLQVMRDLPSQVVGLCMFTYQNGIGPMLMPLVVSGSDMFRSLEAR